MKKSNSDKNTTQVKVLDFLHGLFNFSFAKYASFENIPVSYKPFLDKIESAPDETNP